MVPLFQRFMCFSCVFLIWVYDRHPLNVAYYIYMNIWDDSMLSLQPTSLQTLTPLDWSKQHCLPTLWSLARAHIAGNYWERTNLVDKSITYCDTHAVSFAFVDVGPVRIQSNVAVLNLWNHHQENGVLQKVVPSHGQLLLTQILHKLRGLYSNLYGARFPPFARLQRRLGWCSTIASRFRVSWSQGWEKNIQAKHWRFKVD